MATFQERYQYNPKTDLLGKGGFARVYKAKDVLLDREMAIKIFTSSEEQGRYTVVEEIKKVIKLRHPNLLAYYDVALIENTNSVGETEMLQIGVMELANAGDLKQFARNNPGSPVLFKLLQQVLSGLEYLHSKGIIHRDLKPQNILLVEEDGELTAKISDFGISKSTDSGTNSSSVAIGTIEYMAPEQFNPGKYGINGKIGTNVDLWSFGIMVHELLTNEPLFGQRSGNTTAEQIMSSILSNETPQDVDKLPEPYRNAIKQCLVKDAKGRVQKANELIAVLQGSPAPANQGSNETIVLPRQHTAQAATETVVLPKVANPKPNPKTEKDKRPALKTKKILIAGVIAISFVTVAAFRWGIWLKYALTGVVIGTSPDGLDEGLATVYRKDKMGYIDEKTGKEVTPIKYDSGLDFSEGLARVELNKKFGYIDKTGKEVIPIKYDGVSEFHDGLASVVLNNKRGWIDKTGKEVTPIKYDSIFVFYNGLAIVEMNNKRGYIDKTGKELTPIKYDLAGTHSDGLAIVGLNKKFGYIDKSGREVTSIKYDGAGEFHDGLACVVLNGKGAGYIDKTGKEVIPITLKYGVLGSFSDGLAYVGQNGKCGYIDKTGKEVIPMDLKYDNGGNFSSGLAPVALNNKWGYIDRTGKEMIPTKYDAAGLFSEGLAPVALNNKWGYIDRMGKEVISAKYQTAGLFSDGLARVELDDKWGYIDETGKEVIPLKYRVAGDFHDGVSEVELYGSWQRIDKKGKLISQ